VSGCDSRAVLQGVHAPAPEVAGAGGRRLTKDKILAGLPLKALDRQYKDCPLVAVTEKRTRTEIDDYCRALAAAVA
jgi:hypothetical protein